ncbi:GDSL esterase/lipase At5g55050-like [Panicum hallii]|uniref:GDSL esterase/lipase At5g55050-like n=1 Tax=Panicum hallii TaxID=206008 RepID=UPI000DF4D228|nr:GDSL esterase/lipase At5g55050-like [Panicum hallii]
MYVFGDSTLDVGNNNYLPGMNVPRANTPYYGVDFPGLSTGRFSNGLNTADFIAKMIGFVSSPPAYLVLAPRLTLLVSAARTTGVSYASGGAGILDSTNAGNNIPLSKQVHYFNATRSKMAAVAGSGAVSAELSKSFFLVGIGGNDLSVFANAEQARNRSAAQQQSDTAAFYGSLISNYSATITNLYALGARKFAVINVGLAGCLPVARVLDAAGACSEDRNGLAAGFNDALRSLLADLAATLPGLVYSLADSLGLMVATFADPQASGFTDISDACCGSGRLGAEAECSPDAALCANRDQYYFWDRVHPTQRAAILRAQAFFYDGEAKYTTPINFKQLVHVTAA